MLLYSELNHDQQRAVDTCVARISDGEPVTRLFGYAGTGKTSVAHLIAERAGREGAVYGAYSGKACAVLRRKGCDAYTIHSLLLKIERETRTENGKRVLIWRADFDKRDKVRRSGLLVIDESSMIGEWLGSKIMEVGIPVLAVGDPAQLKPINDQGKPETGYFMRERPDALLTKVERHSGPVLNLASHIRTHGARSIRRGEIPESAVLDYDQVIVGKNTTRAAKNEKIRRIRGLGGFMEDGERIICLDNNFKYKTFNGQQYRVRECAAGNRKHQIDVTLECECGVIGPDSCPVCGWDPFRSVPMWAPGFWGREFEVKSRAWREQQGALLATYGYAITAHKAQGSEWESVLVIDESSTWGKDADSWLYTAVTRARDNVAIIRKTGA